MKTSCGSAGNDTGWSAGVGVKLTVLRGVFFSRIAVICSSYALTAVSTLIGK